MASRITTHIPAVFYTSQQAFLFVWMISIFFAKEKANAQTAYNAAAVYGLRKLVPAYTGSAIQVRRVCDNATKDIGFSSCGDLDTVSLKAFAVAANPLTAMSTSAAAAYSLRRLRCSYA